MSKVCFIALFVLFTVTAITARSTDPKRIPRSSNNCSVARKAGDPCTSNFDCRCGNSKMECVKINNLTFQCQVHVPDPKDDYEATITESSKRQHIEHEEIMNNFKLVKV